MSVTPGMHPWGTKLFVPTSLLVNSVRRRHVLLFRFPCGVGVVHLTMRNRVSRATLGTVVTVRVLCPLLRLGNVRFSRQ